MLYTEMDLKDDEFFTKHLKTLSFGKEKKKPQAKMEKALNNWLWRYHSDVHDHLKSKFKNVQLILNKKHSGYTIIHECLDDFKFTNNKDLTVSTNDKDYSTTMVSNSKISSFKQFIKGSLMYSVFNSALEDSINKLSNIGALRNRPTVFNYSSLDTFFDNEK